MTKWTSNSYSTCDFGWRFDGKIVAPACVDPYFRIMPIARMIFDKVNAFPNPNERDRILDRILYKYNYQKTNTVFRPGAAEFFSRLRELEQVANPLTQSLSPISHHTCTREDPSSWEETILLILVGLSSVLWVPQESMSLIIPSMIFQNVYPFPI